MTAYTALTFAPVQGFIERSRKLRDLFGASQILSFLSQAIAQTASRAEIEVISPASISLQKGLPNRILLKGQFSKERVQEVIETAWRNLLDTCREWVEKQLPQDYQWYESWNNWAKYTWEVFWGEGNTIKEAMENLETNKLSRDWTALNWVGESSSLSGTDAIVWPRMNRKINPRTLNQTEENQEITAFYLQLSEKLGEGFLDDRERLSLPELVKRLLTRNNLADALGMEKLGDSFKDIYRVPPKNSPHPGHWTGWFMGDGDEVGKHLKKLSEKANPDHEIHQFSQAIRNWGKNFQQNFPDDLGRIVYAGGDDFLGVIYSSDPNQSDVKKIEQKKNILKWLKGLSEEWKEHEQPINLSVGFVWAAPGVPQRDVLQHCRETEKLSKSRGRNRVTIRIVFNSGQYVEWTCPWNELGILSQYHDRNGEKNWSHIYGDLAQLENRHAFREENEDKIARALLRLYFGINTDVEFLKRISEKDTSAKFLNQWVQNLVKIGWYLCDNPKEAV